MRVPDPARATAYSCATAGGAPRRVAPRDAISRTIMSFAARGAAETAGATGSASAASIINGASTAASPPARARRRSASHGGSAGGISPSGIGTSGGLKCLAYRLDCGTKAGLMLPAGSEWWRRREYCPDATERRRLQSPPAPGSTLRAMPDRRRRPRLVVAAREPRHCPGALGGFVLFVYGVVPTLQPALRRL